ncbi:MAG: hypothetical protein WCD76_20420 [Pyrinomonadaceae bacterium]
MSKKQSESNFAETFVSLVMLTAKHPEATKAAFRTIDALGVVTYELTSAALDYLFPPKREAATQEPKALPSCVDEEQEAFMPAPLWPTTRVRLAGFVNGFTPVYENQDSGIFQIPGISDL